MCKYKRIVLKISGEALSGSAGHGINSEIVNKISNVIKRINEMGVEEMCIRDRDIAMQVAAMSPKYISMEDVDAEFIAQEKEILTAQTLNEGKPQNIVEKIVEGRLNKELKEICLLEQAFVKDADLTVKKVISDTAKKLGSDIKITGVLRYEVGEGIEKKSENFADEVAKQMGL